jgi:hypothetical protein
VDQEGLRAAAFEDGRAHLTMAGWALGAPLALGAAALILVGSHEVLSRGRVRAAGLWAGGVLVLVWPFDLPVGGVTLAPFALLMGVACIYVALAPTRAGPGPEGAPGDEDGPRDVKGAGGPQEG